jgi:hypothetical protein
MSSGLPNSAYAEGAQQWGGVQAFRHGAVRWEGQRHGRAHFVGVVAIIVKLPHTLRTRCDGQLRHPPLA